jgi:hypothetical protein
VGPDFLVQATFSAVGLDTSSLYILVPVLICATLDKNMETNSVPLMMNPQPDFVAWLIHGTFFTGNLFY